MASSAATPTDAADTARWTLTTGDLQRQPVQWEGLSAAGISLSNPGREVPWDNVVSLERLSAPAVADNAITLVLANGSRLVGTPIALGETSLQWREAKIGSMTVPLKEIRSIDRGTQPSAAPSPTDRVQFTNGDSATGVITDVAAEYISIKTDAGSSTLPIANIQRVTFAEVGPVKPAAAPAGVLVRLVIDDGSLLDATDIGFADDTLTFTPSGSKKPASLPIDAVISLQHLNGPVAWLAARSPAEQSCESFFPFAPPVPVRFATSTDAAPNDITVHGRSSLRYAIEPGWTRLRAKYQLKPIDADAPAWADMTLRVKLDGRVEFERKHVRADAPGGTIDVPINDAKAVTLETDFGDVAGAQADLTWIEPALLRQR